MSVLRMCGQISSSELESIDTCTHYEIHSNLTKASVKDAMYGSLLTTCF